MGAHSTIDVTRNALLVYISTKLLSLDDNELEAVGDTLLYNRLYNCRITNDDEDNDNNLLKE